MPSRPSRLPALLAASLLGLVAPVVSGGGAGATNDPHWPKQWAPPKIGAPAAWATTTGAGVKIGIVDSGVDATHEDLRDRVVASAACIGTDGEPAGCAAGQGQDQVGHGTHVAGIAAATKDNGRGIAGIAPSAQLVVARVFQGESAELSDVEAGIRWVVGQGAKVVNLSLGENVLLGGLLGSGESSLAPALNAAWEAGAIPVIAAGNAQLLGGNTTYGDVNSVVVGATGPEDRRASYSVPTENAKWAILAPGGDGAAAGQIYSTVPNGQYGYLAGTSMAVPHVSGALALLLSRGVSKERAVELVLATADRRVSCGSNSPTCVGRLDVASAVAATVPGGSPASTAASTAAPPN
ncbi:MAG: S8 family serine peptidase, partial [Actinomycetota bacterium]|nr:S8 family serine peptidase [Actinomycetota bacterium]